MSFFPNTGSALRRSTSHIFRRFGGVTEVREVCDKAAQVAVQAFPMPLVASIVASEAAHPGCYVLADQASLYVGETNNVDRRLGEHAADPQKHFAREVFVVHGVNGCRFGKDAAAYLQYHLTEAAEGAGLMTVLKGSPPRLPDIDPLDEPAYAAMLERFPLNMGHYAYPACRK
jgi:GIY-YIG catalytic domain